MSLPPLQPPHAALLTRYLLANENLSALLAQPDAPALLSLLEFLARPDITPWLDHHRALISRANQRAALDALTQVLGDTHDPTQRRLAATALLHHRTLRAPRSTSAVDSDAHRSDPGAAAPARRKTPPTPHPASPSPLDASMPSGLDAFPSLTHPPSPTTLDQAIATLNLAFPGQPPLDRDLDQQADDDLDQTIDDAIDDALDNALGNALDRDALLHLDADPTAAPPDPHPQPHGPDPWADPTSRAPQPIPTD